jgi:hypothetical protein
MKQFGAVALGLLAACSEEPVVETPSAAFPENYAETYAVVRDCRKSGDHDLSYVRILADPAALGAYRDRTTPFPDGAVVLKEEYEFSDATCSSAVSSWTVMIKADAEADQLGWNWQRVDGQRRVTELNAGRCQNCHLDCTGGSGVGYDYTCAEP